LGVDINLAIVEAAKSAASAIAVFRCQDALHFIRSSALSEFTVVVASYECLNALGADGAKALLMELQQRCRPGTWLFADVRTVPHFQGVRYEVTTCCPYFSGHTNEFWIREYGYTRTQKFFGNRYVRLVPEPHAIAHSMLQLFEPAEMKQIVADAGLKWVRSERLLEHQSTDVPECASNLFFTARTQ
jgi:hypothetical protein